MQNDWASYVSQLQHFKLNAVSCSSSLKEVAASRAKRAAKNRVKLEGTLHLRNISSCPIKIMSITVQGVKFYPPEVTGATPEAVEYRGVSNLVQAVKANLLAATGSVRVFDSAAEVTSLMQYLKLLPTGALCKNLY